MSSAQDASRAVQVQEGPKPAAVDEGRLKHLEFIQNVINRMAGSSFLIKGWSVTVAAALVVLSAKDSDARFVLLALFPATMFWALDAYFLRQERLFRRLYDTARRNTDVGGPFSMSTGPYADQEPNTFLTMFSGTLIAFHGVILVSIAIICVILWQARAI